MSQTKAKSRSKTSRPKKAPSGPASQEHVSDSGVPEKKTTKAPAPEERLQQLIRVVEDAAVAKGWKAAVTAIDQKNHQFATVSVSRYPPDTFEKITGTFEITSADRLKITYHKTSFHDWGLSDLNEAVQIEFWRLPWLRPRKQETVSAASPAEILEPLLRRFHSIVRQLKHRRQNRPPLTINDEYDAQDLLHAVLRGLFDDVRAEEFAPSYAGGSSRMDFLLKAERVVIELKMANANLRDKQIGEQLIVDIAKYQKHQDCKRLICFVYDPGGFIKNASGLENDLSRNHGALTVRVIVVSL